MMTETYDICTYVHWLYWRLRCLEASGDQFQRLFEDVAARCHDHFVRVRPYGKLGDRKCDGLYWGNGTVYQVYSPDEMKESQTRAKIEEDLSGAVEHWGEKLNRWVFVYNVRKGLPPDVPQLLLNQSRLYPNITIEPMSNDDLWKIVKKLPAQDRVEILGPPPGYETLFPLKAALPEELAHRLQNGRFVIVQDILSPINVADAVQALEPNPPFAPPLFVRPPSVPDWELAAEYQKAVVEDAVQRSREQLPRFAVFSLSPVPLAVHLGFLLSDRIEVEPFQFDRDRKTWCWGTSPGPADSEFIISGMPEAVVQEPAEAVIRVSLSAHIQAPDSIQLNEEPSIDIELSVATPDVMWLTSPHQLVEFGRAFRRILADIRRDVPNCPRIHLLYAGPTGGAIVAGQAINPRMNPPVLLYEYDRAKRPRYSHVLTLD